MDIEPGVELDSRKESVRRKVLVRTVELGCCEKGSEGQCRTTIVDKCIAPDGRWFRTMRAEWERKVSSLPGGRTIGLHTAAGNCSFLQSRANKQRKKEKRKEKKIKKCKLVSQLDRNYSSSSVPMQFVTISHKADHSKIA